MTNGNVMRLPRLVGWDIRRHSAINPELDDLAILGCTLREAVDIAVDWLAMYPHWYALELEPRWDYGTRWDYT